MVDFTCCSIILDSSFLIQCMWFPLTLLTAFLWAMINVGNSTLVKKYSKTPVLLLWVQTCFSMLFLLGIAITHSVSTPWAPVLFGCAIIAYAGDLFFFRVLDHLDVSVVNAAWAIEIIFISIAGFLLFGDFWTIREFVGAGLVLIGVLLLSFFNVHVSLLRTLFLLTSLAALYTPVFIAKKAAMVAGQPILPVVFWLILGRDLFSFLTPLFLPRYRRMFIHALPACTLSFFLISALVIFCFYAAEFAGARALAMGPVSLISVVGNVQPFFAILLSGLLVRFWPSLAPREFFSIRSTGIKMVSFLIVFLGLALIAVSE